MGRLGLIAGHSLLGSGFLAEAERTPVATPAGPVTLIDVGEFVYCQRHGLDRYRSAYVIDHAANLRALAAAGCDRLLAICSVGALREELAVGTFVAPDDFVALHLGISLFDDERGERVPSLDPEWRRQVIEAWDERSDVPLRDGGVYWQAIGPRFETPAEIRLIAAHADVIGMTLAAECTLAGDLELPYAAVCVVDNLANGLGPAKLTVSEFQAGKAANRERLVGALVEVLPALAGVAA